ncbi:MAG: tRNA lysidine(34) synthetase TilS [Pseudolabrys sp.]
MFAGFASATALVLAVSGGPDSTALMVLAARWRKARKTGPELVAVTVDHGLRADSKREARDVARLAKQLGLAHRTMCWTGVKPRTGIPQAAREARYRLLANAARKAGAQHILTAHTRDDQAETVLIRMSRGSGVTGLTGMAMSTRLHVPGLPVLDETRSLLLVRPFLDIPKLRLIATLDKAKILYADDPTNRDAAFTRARLRRLMPQLATEGLDARRLAVLARRLRRANEAIEAATDRAMETVMLPGARELARFDAAGFFVLPEELALRALGRAIVVLGANFRVELAKLEALFAALTEAGKAGGRWRRTLAGALVTLDKGRITVEAAPARRAGHGRNGRNALTTAGRKRAGAAKSR